MIEQEKKGENMKLKKFSHKSPSKRWLRMEFTACYGKLMIEKALTSFTIMLRISLLCRSVRLLTSQNRSYAIYLIPYLIPTNSIIVFDRYFKLMNKSNFVGKL